MQWAGRIFLAGAATWLLAGTALAQAITDPTKPPPPTPTGQPNPPQSAPSAPPSGATGANGGSQRSPPQSASSAAAAAAGSATSAAQSASGLPVVQAPPPPSEFTFTAAYTADALADVHGGLSPGEGYADLLKLSVSFEGSRRGLEGFTAQASVEHFFGSDFTSDRVGGFQNVSANETEPGAFRLYELWVQQTFLGDHLGVKAGLVDLNTTFDVQETAALFLNASQGIGPELGDTGPNGPSNYPTPAAAAVGYWRPGPDWTLQLGVFDAEAGNAHNRADFVAVKFDGALFITQVEKRFADRARAEFGAWTYTRSYPWLGLPPSQARSGSGDDGVYGLFEGRITGSGDGPGLNAWVRAGVANAEINPVANYLGAGLVYTGLIKGRDKDEIGLDMARVGFGDGAKREAELAGERLDRAETNIEASYRYVMTDWLNVQPDVQYVIDPHGISARRNALVVGLRLAFSYTH